MRRLLPSLAACLFLTLFSSSRLVIAYQSDDPPDPTNVRIEIEGTRLVAKWSYSESDYSFSFEHRKRVSGSGTSWSDVDWQYGGTTSSTSQGFARTSDVPDGEAWDFQIKVYAFRSGIFSIARTATRGSVRNSSSGGSSRSGGSGSGSSSSNSGSALRGVRPSPVPPETCQTLSTSGSGIIVSFSIDLRYDIQCQQLDGAGIGIQSIVEAGFTNAVDVWGYVREAQVCFENASGSLLFLDAAAAPRTITPLQSISVEGMICAVINRPGSVVLIPSTTAESTTAESTTTVQVPIQAVQLESCKVTMNYILNLRDAPAGPKVLAWIPYLARLDASARTDEWFFVEWLGISGWVLAEFVYAQGNCG